MNTDALDATADSHTFQTAERDKGIISDMGDAVFDDDSAGIPSVCVPGNSHEVREICHSSCSADSEDTVGIVPCGVITQCAALGKKCSCACYKREDKNE